MRGFQPTKGSVFYLISGVFGMNSAQCSGETWGQHGPTKNSPDLLNSTLSLMPLLQRRAVFFVLFLSQANKYCFINPISAGVSPYVGESVSALLEIKHIWCAGR